MSAPLPPPPPSTAPLGVGGALLTAAVAFVAAQIATAIVVTVALLARGGSANDIYRTPWLLSLAAAVTGGTLACVGALALNLTRRRVWDGIAFHRPRASHVAFAVVIVLTAAPFADVCASAFQRLFPTWTLGVVEGITEASQKPSAALLFVALTVCPGFAEELLFRGVLQRAFTARLGAAWGVTLASLLFGAFHVDPPQAIGAGLLGVPLGIVTLRTRSIVPAMVAHAANNLVALGLARAGGTAPTDTSLWHLPIAGAILIAASVGLARSTRPTPPDVALVASRP